VYYRKFRTRPGIAGGMLTLLFLAFLTPLPAVLGAQATADRATVQPRLLTLDEAVRTAEAQSEAIRIARAGVQRAQGQQYQARSQYLPQVNASAAYTRTLASQFSSIGGNAPPVDTTKPLPPPAPCDQYLLGPTATTEERLAGLENASRCSLGGNPFSSFGSLGFGAKNQYNLGLSFSQNLFAGGRIRAQNAVANAGRTSAEIELAAQRAQIRLDVTQAYFDAALADRLVALAESSAVQTENVLRQTQLARNVGNVSEFELLRAQVSSANQRPIVTIGLASEIPLFTGGRIKGEQMVAEANVREAQARYDQLREFAALDSRVTLNNLFQARAAWLASAGTADQARRAYSIAEVRYKEGISTQIELNDARILLEQAVANRALAARNLQVARVKLALLPDLPLQATGATQAQAQQTQAAATQQQPSQQGSQQTQTAQQQSQGQPATGIPPQ
jgi:outer membrane protein TolC